MNGTGRKPPIRTRRWVRIALSAAIAGNLIGAGGAIYLLGGPDELTVDEAVRQFRENASAPGPDGVESPGSSVEPTPTSTVTRAPSAKKPSTTKPKGTSQSLAYTEPALGVYVYATDGYEETDALSGQRHDYPAETALTISRQG
ncbi:MAG: hypothetical protein ACRDKS_15455, partial [Actinomycetota bacterium]